MQVFLPFPDIDKSLRCLDKKRLGKQRVEAKQLINTITGISDGWKNHPCTKMYTEYLGFLKHYYNRSLSIFSEKGGNNILLQPIEETDIVNPPWFGSEEFHRSHLSNLLRKAIDDNNGLGRDGPKNPSSELLVNLKKFGFYPDNLSANIEYIWYA